MPVCFEWNGRVVELADAEVHPHVSLLSWLRSAGATGSKEGCAEGECGACAVALIEPAEPQRQAGPTGPGGAFVPLNSCLIPLAAVHGRKLLSVEGIAAVGASVEAGSGELHPVQRAMVEHAGSQCGYCTPGFVVSMFCEYYRPERTGFDLEALSGNLCRCTGYRPIVSAARSLAAPAANDPHLQRLQRLQPEPLPGFVTRCGAYTYLRPTNLPELLTAWQQQPSAVLIAGGTDLMVYVNQRGARMPTLLALDGIPELRELTADAGELRIGAALPLSELGASPQLRASPDLASLRQLLPLFASRLIRNRASLGGNLATASPIGDAAPVLLALDAQLTLASATGERRLPLQAFFAGYREHVLGPGELIRTVVVPRPAPRLQRFYKVSKRHLDDISTVSAAFALDLAADRSVTRLRIAYGGVAATPLRALEVEQLLLGRVWDARSCRLACEALHELPAPIADHRGSAAYRAALVPKLFEKFFAESSAPLPVAAP